MSPCNIQYVFHDKDCFSEGTVHTLVHEHILGFSYQKNLLPMNCCCGKRKKKPVQKVRIGISAQALFRLSEKGERRENGFGFIALSFCDAVVFLQDVYNFE